MILDNNYLNTKGRIFDIQKYSISNRPGNKDYCVFEGLCIQMQMVL